MLSINNQHQEEHQIPEFLVAHCAQFILRCHQNRVGLDLVQFCVKDLLDFLDALLDISIEVLHELGLLVLQQYIIIVLVHQQRLLEQIVNLDVLLTKG